MKKQRKLEKNKLPNNKMYNIDNKCNKRSVKAERDWDVSPTFKEDFSLGNIFKTISIEVDPVIQVKYFKRFKI